MSGGHNRNQTFASIGVGCRMVIGHLAGEALNHAECSGAWKVQGCDM